MQQLNVGLELLMQLLVASQHVHECTRRSSDVGWIAAAVHVARAVESHVRAQQTGAQSHASDSSHGSTERGTHQLDVRGLSGTWCR